MAKAKAASQGSLKAKKTRKPAAAKVAKSEVSTPRGHEPPLELALQQKCLDIFRDALRPGADDVAILQEVKNHLYNRDFASAFGNREYLRVYACRWSPSRALGYLQILTDIRHLVLPNQDSAHLGQSDVHALEVVCLGGGAGAEVIALAGWTSLLLETLPDFALQARFVDIAAWDATVAALHKHCVTAPELSKYSSAAAREANRSWIPAHNFECSFYQQDILDWREDAIKSIVTPPTKLVTLLFTLNELYSTSLANTRHLLSELTTAMATDSFLLVVDSPGSYSTVTLNNAEKKYPMQWLLDHTLLGPAGGTSGGRAASWEKVSSDDSRWLRLPQGLQYPIELENMRYQIHLYRRLGDDGDD